MLKLTNVCKTFSPGTVNEKKALEEVSLRLEPGEWATLVGSNGAGKSTLLGAVAGTFYPDRGSVVLGDEDITFWPEHRRSREMGRLFQNPLGGTAPHMTIEENLALAYLRAGRGRGAWFSRIGRADRDFFRQVGFAEFEFRQFIDRFAGQPAQFDLHFQFFSLAALYQVTEQLRSPRQAVSHTPFAADHDHGIGGLHLELEQVDGFRLHRETPGQDQSRTGPLNDGPPVVDLK